MMTPEQAIDLYKANTKIALDIINAALEGTAKVRKLQFEGEEQARAMGRKYVRISLGGARDEACKVPADRRGVALEQRVKCLLITLAKQLHQRLVITTRWLIAGFHRGEATA